MHGNGAQQNDSERGKNTKDTVLIKVFQGALSHIRAKPNKITACKNTFGNYDRIQKQLPCLLGDVKNTGSTGIRTQVSGIRIRCDNQLHYGTVVLIIFLRICLLHGNGAQQNDSERGKIQKTPS